MNVVKNIEGWQKSRGLHLGGYDQWQSVYNDLEETFEGLGFASGMAKHFAYKYQDLIKADWKLAGCPQASFEAIVDSKCDKVVFAIGDMLKVNADPSEALHETFLEISSRMQDPEQAERWDTVGRLEGEKWQKWKDQPVDTLYKAEYKIVSLNRPTIKEELEDMLNESYGVL